MSAKFGQQKDKKTQVQTNLNDNYDIITARSSDFRKML